MELEGDFARRAKKIRDGGIIGLLDVIRLRPALYTGERSLSSVCSYLAGFRFAQNVYQIPLSGSDLPRDFNEWVAYRLHFDSATSGFRTMILDRYPDESAALDRFFALLDEHRTRQGKIVATVRPGRPGYAEEINLLVYTDDPGVFLVYDDNDVEPRDFCPSLSLVPLGDLTILDQAEYDRLLRVGMETQGE